MSNLEAVPKEEKIGYYLAKINKMGQLNISPWTNFQIIWKHAYLVGEKNPFLDVQKLQHVLKTTSYMANRIHFYVVKVKQN